MQTLQTYINEKLILSKTRYKYPENEYLYHETLEDGYSTKFINTENILQYSIDDCKTWHDLEPKTETPKINKGERIYFKGENMEVTDYGIGIFMFNKKFNVGGNIMSLIYGDDFKGQNKLLKNGQFRFLFFQNLCLISAKDLILPATELTEECYTGMFNECESLIEAPELPASKLTKYCYSGMFYFCRSLTESPELPATKLADKCYNNMFYNCNSLTTSPKLQATKLTKECYLNMFGRCTSLKEITMLATDMSAQGCLYNWVSNVSDTGTFIKAKGVNIQIGINGIPKGWDVKEI
jgi:hypothetical protein